MKSYSLTGLLILASEWVMRLGVLTILWFSFTLSGLIVFGFMPATAAMFSVLRKWIDREEDLPVYRHFTSVFKAEFFKVNMLGIILLLTGLIIFLDWKFFNSSNSPFYHSVSYVFVFLSFIFFIILLYIFPVFSHYEYKTINYIKNSLLIAILNPGTTLTMIGVCILIYFISRILPGILVFFSISVFAFALAFPANKAFQKLEQRQQLLR
jgi:uncharacterized membrane protein YesL